MWQGTFRLNDEPMSKLEIASFRLDAFSGDGKHRNKRNSMCLANEGPIPHGLYYIVDRGSGGPIGKINTVLSGAWDWFALYANDGKIDDWTFCNKVERGLFRLHPKGWRGSSKGCIVVDDPVKFRNLRNFLLSQKHIIPSKEIRTYGTIRVI